MSTKRLIQGLNNLQHKKQALLKHTLYMKPKPHPSMHPNRTPVRTQTAPPPKRKNYRMRGLLHLYQQREWNINDPFIFIHQLCGYRVERWLLTSSEGP